jgi:hypothetical protein
MQHQTAFKRILRYLSKTQAYGIIYKYSSEPISFKGYTDTAYQNQNNCKFTTSYIFIAAEGAITWQSENKASLPNCPQRLNILPCGRLGKRLYG